jgi:hypothetical protein
MVDMSDTEDRYSIIDVATLSNFCTVDIIDFAITVVKCQTAVYFTMLIKKNMVCVVRECFIKFCSILF